MSHKNKQKTFFISSIIFLLLGCTQKPVDIVSPTQPNIILETPIPNRNPTPTITSQPQVAQEDTGYEGYYTGIVVITEYYTLLNNELLEEAYERLSISEQNENSLKEFIQLNEGVTSEIVTIKPLVIWQIEQGISPFIKDKEGRIGFVVELFNSQRGKHALFFSLVKESENWKIDVISENLITVMFETSTTPILDIGSVPDRSYYDSIVTIAKFHVLFNYSLYKNAHQLLSSFRRNPQNLDEFISDIQTFGIVKRQIISIRPFYEGTLQLQTFTTPVPSVRRMFYAELYVEGKGGWAGSVPNGLYGYYITTIFEQDKWKIYSVNTVGLP